MKIYINHLHYIHLNIGDNRDLCTKLVSYSLFHSSFTHVLKFFSSVKNFRNWKENCTYACQTCKHRNRTLSIYNYKTKQQKTVVCATLFSGKYITVYHCFLPWKNAGHYRPQRSWGKVIFSQASVILLTGGGSGLSACWDATPPDQAPTPLGADTTPRHRACWEIRSTRGRYVSYWNAILFDTVFFLGQS